MELPDDSMSGSLGPRGNSTVIPAHFPDSEWQHKYRHGARYAGRLCLRHSSQVHLHPRLGKLCELARKLSALLVPTPWPVRAVYILKAMELVSL